MLVVCEVEHELEHFKRSLMYSKCLIPKTRARGKGAKELCWALPTPVQMLVRTLVLESLPSLVRYIDVRGARILRAHEGAAICYYVRQLNPTKVSAELGRPEKQDMPRSHGYSESSRT